MEFTTREDIEAPLEQVFAHATNFEQIERQIMRRSIPAFAPAISSLLPPAGSGA